MTRTEIIQRLREEHQSFTAYILGLDEAGFCHAPPGKWTAGQQLDHIRRSLAPVAMAFGLPRFVPWLLFGKADRASRNYDTLTADYRAVLAAGGKAGARYVPRVIPYEQKTALVQTLTETVERLCRLTETREEAGLDAFLLPHPLLGKLTGREMLYFSIYHVAHHHKISRINLQNRPL